MAKKSAKSKLIVEAIRHEDASRKNIPTAEYESVMEETAKYDVRVAYERRNRDLDPQLVWRGKDEQDWSDLVVNAPPHYIQEKVHPKVLIDDLLRQTKDAKDAGKPMRQLDLFADFNGLPDHDAKTEFYQHDQNWSNRKILGDSLQVMASLAEREGLKGKVQCIYFDPPYGIKFNSNFQWSTTSRDVKDGSTSHITREPEQVKAFRDTWRDGIHSYLTYLRDRLVVARDLLTDSGSIFVQIGDENVHRVRALMDEVFGDANFVSLIPFKTTTSSGASLLEGVCDYLVWFAKSKDKIKYRQLYFDKAVGAEGASAYGRIESAPFDRRNLTSNEKSSPEQIDINFRIYRIDNLTSQRPLQGADLSNFEFEGRKYSPGRGTFKTDSIGMTRLSKSSRLEPTNATKLYYVRYIVDFPVFPMSNQWADTSVAGFAADKLYVVQSSTKVIQRCIQMTTDPGDLVLDPTCGSGTTATVSEQWGRRWITIDTSRVALALARARIMGARYPYYLLADSRDGAAKEAELQRSLTNHQPLATNHSSNIRHGFVYQRVPHITLKSIANNTEIDVIWDKYQRQLEPIRDQLNKALKQKWEEWEIPRELDDKWAKEAKQLHGDWWKHRIARQNEIDASIASKAEFEFLYDKPYEDKSKVRVAGPFTVESLSPHRVLTVGADDELVDSGLCLVAGETQTTSHKSQTTADVASGLWLVAGKTQDTNLKSQATLLAAIQSLSPQDFPLTQTTSHKTQVTIHGVDVFHPHTGEVRSDGADGIACWFIDSDCNEESFFVRHAYFLGANDPYKSLKTTLKAEIDEEAWSSLNSDTSRPFDKPNSGRIAVKVINHLGDEVMKVFKVVAGD